MHRNQSERCPTCTRTLICSDEPGTKTKSGCETQTRPQSAPSSLDEFRSAMTTGTRDNHWIITGRSHDADPLQQAETSISNNLQSKNFVTISCFQGLNNHQQLSGFHHLITRSLVSPGHMEVLLWFLIISVLCTTLTSFTCIKSSAMTS